MSSASCRSSSYRSSPSYWWGRVRVRGEGLDLPS
ncbi:unnamed protein product [Ectocarpus sp. 8 AP-2014]